MVKRIGANFDLVAGLRRKDAEWAVCRRLKRKASEYVRDDHYCYVSL
jgi:hypothetical protein